MARASKDVLDIINKRKKFDSDSKEDKSQAPVKKNSTIANTSENKVSSPKTEIRGKRASQEVLDIINKRNKFASRPSVSKPSISSPVAHPATGGISSIKAPTVTKAPTLSSATDVESRILKLSTELAELNSKYTDDYWNKLLEDETAKYLAENPMAGTAIEAWQKVEDESKPINERKEALQKQIDELVSGMYNYRDANFLDLTVNSAKRGWHNSAYGTAVWDADKAKVNELEGKLDSEDYKFKTDSWWEKAISGAMEQAGQMAYTTTRPDTITLTLGGASAAAGAAALAGQAGPQVMLPEEVISVPVAAAMGARVGFGSAAAINAMKIEGGHAYKEMIDNGVSPETAEKIALAVGGANGLIEAIQLDELIDAFKVVGGKGTSQSVFSLILNELKRRGIDVFKESTQEVVQEGVTMGGVELGSRIDNGEGVYSAKDVGERALDTFTSSMLTFGAMNIPSATVNTTRNIVDNNRLNKIGETYSADVDSVIQAGLERDVNSEAHKVAEDLQNKRNSGETITNSEIGNAVVATVQELRKEQGYSDLETDAQPSSLEEAAEMRVNDIETNKTAENTDDIPKADNLPTRTEKTETEVKEPVTKGVAEVETKTDTSTSDTVATPSVAELQKAQEAKAEEAAFEAGRQNVPREHVTLATPAQEEAYNAGRIEHIKNMPKEENLDSKNEQAYNVSGKLTDKTKRVFAKGRDIGVSFSDERGYISDGYIALPIDETDASFAKSEWGVKDSDKLSTIVEHIINRDDFIPLTSNPVEGKVMDGMSKNGSAAYIFTLDDGRQFGVRKKYVQHLDGNSLSVVFDKGKPLAIKAMDSDGNFVGMALAIRHNGDTYDITDTKEVSMKSFKNKPASKTETRSTDDIALSFEEKDKKKREVMSRYGLSEDEANAVVKYKEPEAYKINAKLREDESLLDETQKKTVEFLDSALEKLPKHKGRAFRTVSFDDVFDSEEMYNDFLEKHKEGKLVIYDAYTSASSKIDGHPMDENTKYGITLEIDGESARDVDGFGNNFEKEVIFPRRRSFVVTEVGTDNDGRPYIKVKEVGNHDRQQRYSEERGDVLQRVRTEEELHSNVQEVSERNSLQSGDTKNSVQGVRADKVNNPQDKIAKDVIKYIEKGKDFSSARLFEIADKAYGGTMAEGAYTVKDAYDGMELAVNRYLMNAEFVKNANGDASVAVETTNKLIDLLTHIPTQTKRTAEQESYQQFSTPPNIAYISAWVANIDNADVVLEPSAGIGGLALWGKAWGATVYANELSERRLEFLNQLGLDGTFNLNAEQIDNLLPDNIKPSVVVMNPPFSATAGRMSKNNTANAKRHIEQALERLEPNGRLVAILGNGMADDAPSFKSWWNDLRSEYGVRANIRIDGSNYRKYGTTFDVQLVVIDKTGPNTEQTITGTYKDLSEIPTLLEGIRDDRQAVVRDSDVSIERDTTARNDTERQGRLERSAGDTSDVLDGKQASEDSNRTPDSKRTKRSDGVRGKSEGNSKAVSKNARSENDSTVDGSNAGTRMELSRNTESDVVGKSSVKEFEENPDSVYSTYIPRKVNIKGAKKHPARLVESAAMAAVDPPDVTYTPALPASIAEKGILSDAQLENVVYAGQAHSQMLGDGKRKGYFIGDGTGVGKGRQISGIIMDNFLQGRKKAVWISASTGLVNDAKRDWQDLGGNPDDIIDLKGTKLLKTGIEADSGILFGAYSTLSNSANKEQRFDLLKKWLGEDFDGVIALDEAHKMGNSVPMKKKRGKSKPSQQALTGIELQKTFPNARIVYASATGATDVSQYGYLERLGLWGKGTAFNDLNDFINKISNGGLAAMELVARDMKAMGVYMARSISYDDVKYDTLQHDLTPMQTEIYDTMSEAWQKVLQNVNEALEVTGADKNGQARGAAYSAIFGGQQRFYNQILTSMSMPSVIEDMKKELAAGRSCVIQLTNTNEAQANRAIAKNEAEGGNLEDLDLTPSETLTQLLEKSFPIQVFEEYMDEEGRVKSRLVRDADGNPVIDKKAVRMRDNLIAELSQMKVPDGPLEMLLDAFGVDEVAEVTGRSRRVVEKRDENGKMRRVIETRSATAGTADAKAFQDGRKRILVFSDAGGTGFSYHADKRAKNQQQRVHYLLQPGWSASNAVQGFGRTHRSNQASAPIVRLITTNAMGQKRFTSTIARRLDQLGALTKGQRQTGSGVFSEKDNLENPIAADALAQYYKGADRDILKKLGLYDSLFDEYGRLNDGAEDLRNVSKFLNRILALKVDEQNEVFQGFYDTFERMMDVAISNGTVDMGLENYRADKIEVIDEKVVRKDESGADTKYVQMKTYRKPIIAMYDTSHPKFKGLVRMEDGSVRAVYETSSKTNARGEIERRFRLDSPVKGVSNTFVEKTLNEKTTAIDKADWKKAWQEEVAKAPEYTEGTLHLLTGTLLPIWNRLPQNNTRVMRVMSSDGRQYLGRVIAPSQIDLVLRGLGAGRTMQTYTPQQISDAVLKQGKEAVLRDDRQKIVRRRVSNEWRMEVTGQNTWYLVRRYPDIISERINYEYRYFIPTGEAGNKILEDLVKNNPVVDMREETKSGDVDYMHGAKEADHSEQWTAERVGDKNKKPKSLSQIIEDIRHDFGVNITTGHIRGSDIRGTHERGTGGIRTKKALDLPTIAHELGHEFDEKYGLQDGISEEMKNELLGQLDDGLKQKYKENKLVGEGIAEYVRKFLQNRETAAIDYPLFTDHFLGSMTGKELAQLEQLADDVNAYYALDADTATSSIQLYGEKAPDARTVGEKLKAKADAIYQAWGDANHGIKRFDVATGANTYKLATNAAYSDAIAGNMISGGDLTDANGKYVAPGLMTALHGLDLNNKEEYRLFGEYLTVKHGPERLAEGLRTFSDDRKNNTAWMNNRQAEIERQHPEFVEISERLYKFWDKFMQTWAVNTGLVDKATYQSWRDRWEYYVPFNRVVNQDGITQGAKRGFANQNSTIKKARGSGRDIIHPVDNMIANLVKMVNAGVRNNVMVQITTQAQKLKADASFLEKVPMPLTATKMDMTGVKEKLTEMLETGNMTTKDKLEATGYVDALDDILMQYGRGKAHGDVIFVLKNGQPEAWKINDVGMLSSLTSMSPHTMDGILDALAVTSRFMTANITGNNLVWSIFSNLPRDMMTFFTYSKNKKPLKMAAGIGGAYVNKFKGANADPLYKEFLALGGGQTSVYTSDRNLTKTARKQMTRKTGKGFEKVDWNPLATISFLGNLVESGPRFATYKMMREQGMSPQNAFYEAMDITVNFRRGGRFSREINKVVPFFNANVQGLDKFRRWITAEELAGQSNRKKAVSVRVTSFIAVSAAVAALSYALNNGDDEKEKEYEQLSNFIKNSYWNIPLGDGKYFAIPKPRELGVLSSFFETCMEYGIGDNDHAFDEFYAYASENFIPAIANDIAQVGSKGVKETGLNIIGSAGIIGVFGYLGANRDFLGRPIVSSGLQNLEPKDQYTARTSKIAYWIGQATNGSPQEIDYFFQQILGGWWKTQKALFPVGGENVDYTLGVRNTYIKDNQYSTDLTNWLYDRADTTARAKNSDPTDIDKAISAKWDSNMKSFYGKYYKQAKNKSDTTATRGTRQLVLDMILEYQKGIDNNYKTKTQKAVEKVCKEQNSTEYLPSVMSVTVKDANDKEHTLSDIQYVEYQTDYLRLYWETIEDSLPEAQSASERARIVEAAKRVAREKAQANTLKRIGAGTSKFAKTYEGVSNKHLTEFFAGLDAANTDNSVKKSEVVDVIREIDIEDTEAWALFLSQNDSYGANYAKEKGVAGNKYVEFLDTLDTVDKPTESGNLGSYTQEEATEAIRRVPGISNRDRAILWKSVNKNWKDKNNPWRAYLR